MREFVIILLTLALSSNLIAQDPLTFAEIGDQWLFEAINSNPCDGNNDECINSCYGAFYRISVMTDTVISNRGCTIADVEYRTKSTQWEKVDHKIIFHNDKGKIFTFFTESSEFKLLFDFTLNQGDSLLVQGPELWDETLYDFGQIRTRANHIYTVVDWKEEELYDQTYTSMRYELVERDSNDMFASIYAFERLVVGVGDLRYLFGESLISITGCEVCGSKLHCYKKASKEFAFNNCGCQFPELITSTNEEFVDDAISVFPNPSQDFIRFNTTLIVDRIDVYTLGGQVLEMPILSTNTLDISELTSGVYSLKVYFENEKVGSAKFVKL